MALVLGLGIVALFVAVAPVPVVHTTLAWVGAHVGIAVNHASTQLLNSVTGGHHGAFVQLITALLSVLGMGLGVIALSVIASARAHTRAAVATIAVLALFSSGVYTSDVAGRYTLWIGAVLTLLLFVAVVVFGRLVCVIASLVVGASALASLTDLHSSVMTHAAQQMAVLSRVHQPHLWALVLAGLGIGELCIAARILFSGKVWTSVAPQTGTSSSS